MIVADGRPRVNVPKRGDGVLGVMPQESAEAKRLEARRRFLLGGAAAIPMVVTVNLAKAQDEDDLLTLSECVAAINDPMFDSAFPALKNKFADASRVKFGLCESAVGEG